MRNLGVLFHLVVGLVCHTTLVSRRRSSWGRRTEGTALCVTCLVCSPREGKVDHAWHDYVEGRSIFASVDQVGKNLGGLSEATGPAMTEDQGNCVLAWTRLMDKVDVVGAKAIDVDLGHILWQLVQLGLLLAPVEAILPVVGYSL